VQLTSALQEAVVPPLLPAQVQYQGPVPLIAEAVPATQFTEVGADVSVSPSGEPHTPLVEVEQELTPTVTLLTPVEVPAVFQHSIE